LCLIQSDTKHPRDLIVYWKRKFESKYGDDYAPDWGKDAKLFKSKLNSISGAKINAKIDVFFDDWWDNFWQSKKGRERPKISDFIKNLERIPLAQSTRGRPAGRTGTPRRLLETKDASKRQREDAKSTQQRNRDT
jgi:hypothetical protein